MAVPTDAELKALLEKFVCVRMVQMHGVDLARFQFDGMLTWSAFLMNGDGTIYGRYGSRSARGKQSASEISLEGFKESLRGALQLHDRFRSDPKGLGAALARKTAAASTPWTSPDRTPDLEVRGGGRFLNAYVGEGPTGHGSGNCIHCHHVQQAEIMSLRTTGRPIPERLFWPYPMPDNVGFRLDPRRAATVERVSPDSSASRAGFAKGDKILSLAGQPMLSIADVQWVLHHATDPATIAAEIERGGERHEITLQLPKGWRLGIQDDWRVLSLGMCSQLVGFNFVRLDDEQAKRNGLAGKLAFRVNRRGPRLAREVPLQRGDLIVALDGNREPLNLGGITAYLFTKKKKGSKLELTVRRRGEEIAVVVPILQ